MIVTKEVQRRFAKVWKGLDEKLRTAMELASVKLAKGNGEPVGSGVLLYFKAPENTETAYVITAKHLLYTYRGEKDRPEAAPRDCVDRLAGDCYVHYVTEPGGRFARARVTGVVLLGEKTETAGEWTYDVMLVTSTDTHLVEHAKSNWIAGLNAGHVYPTIVKGESIFLSRKAKAGYDEITLVQTGFGKVSEKLKKEDKKSGRKQRKPEEETLTLPVGSSGNYKEGAFQFRIAEPAGNAATTFYDSLEHSPLERFPFGRVVELKADPTNSTAPGDSGGPLFAVARQYRSMWSVYVVGITTGSDMTTNPNGPEFPGPEEWRVNDIVTSLVPAYGTLQL